MDTSTFYAVTSAACFALVGLWWSVVKDKPEWFKDEAMKRMAGGVYASFLIPGAMSMVAQVGGDVRILWRLVFVIAAGMGIYFSAKLIKTAKSLNPKGAFSKNSWVVPFLYGLLLLFALLPNLAGVVGLAPLQMEGLLLTALILIAHLMAWEFLTTTV